MWIEAFASSVARLGVRAVFVAALALPVAGFDSLEALFAPKADLWDRWDARDPASTAAIDHSVWQRILDTYLSRDSSGLNRFAYGRISDADKRALDQYLGRLTQTPIRRFNRAEQLSYWVNLYNLLTIKVVLADYPVASIRDIDISPGLFADGPWNRKLVDVDGEAVSLNDIEHRILRPIWADPRLHYALNCASVGCPNLQPTAFAVANAESLLEAAAREYVNSPRGARFEGGRLTVSKIYSWFQEDFGNSEKKVIDHLARYADPDLAAALSRTTRISGYEYDWGLNE